MVLWHLCPIPCRLCDVATRSRNTKCLCSCFCSFVVLCFVLFPRFPVSLVPVHVLVRALCLWCCLCWFLVWLISFFFANVSANDGDVGVHVCDTSRKRGVSFASRTGLSRAFFNSPSSFPPGDTGFFMTHNEVAATTFVSESQSQDQVLCETRFGRIQAFRTIAFVGKTKIKQTQTQKLCSSTQTVRVSFFIGVAELLISGTSK